MLGRPGLVSRPRLDEAVHAREQLPAVRPSLEDRYVVYVYTLRILHGGVSIYNNIRASLPVRFVICIVSVVTGRGARPLHTTLTVV